VPLRQTQAYLRSLRVTTHVNEINGEDYGLSRFIMITCRSFNNGMDVDYE
jgi:hypothetical protein